MTRAERWLLHTTACLAAGTGVLYGVMRYLLRPAEPFAIVNHPWQPWVQHLHIWAAPLLVFALGHAWFQHAWHYWRSGQRLGRRSGSLLLLTAAPMVLSGYFVQTAVQPAWRLGWAWVHGVSGLLWLAGYLGHAVTHYARRARGPRPPA